MNTISPFHPGEQSVQTRLGVRETIEPWARQVVRPFLPEQHRAFYAALPFLVAAARDRRGRPWVTLLAGDKGFVRSPDPATLAFAAGPVPDDALAGALSEGDPIGLLGIELATRRRNRVNGRITASGTVGIELRVDQAFGNCPQYIRPREWETVPAGERRPATVERTATLSPAMSALIASADTFFIASGVEGEADDPTAGMDASHRGGNPGFVAVHDAHSLSFPDYAGNNHFNTLGNLVVDPRAGLLFVDFERGTLLQLTGRTEIGWTLAPESVSDGARRRVHFRLEAAVLLEHALPIRWSAPRASVRSLRVVERVRESADVTSFVLAARDDGPLPRFEPGQHLPLSLAVSGDINRLERTYSLSGASDASHYRITVKREPMGAMSRLLHDAVAVGDIIDAGTPDGSFGIHPGSHPVVLVSAGVGITPMVAALHALADDETGRPTWFLHGARDGDHHPLADEVRGLVERHAHLHQHTRYSRPRPHDVQGVDYHDRGHVDGDLLARAVPYHEADFYLCGPLGFMTAVHGALTGLGVDPERIHTETFGPAIPSST